MTDTTTVKPFSPALIDLGVNQLTADDDAVKARRKYITGLKKRGVTLKNLDAYRPEFVKVAFATMARNHPAQDGMTMGEWLASEDVKTRQGSFKSPFPKRNEEGKPLKTFYTKEGIQALMRAYVSRQRKLCVKELSPKTEREKPAAANYYKDTIKAVFPIVERIGATARATDQLLGLQRTLRQAIDQAVAIDKDAAALYTTKKKKAESGNKKK